MLRCHKSHLVNINYIKEYKYENGGTIIMSDNSKIAVSVGRRNFVINFLKQFYSEKKYVPDIKKLMLCFNNKIISDFEETVFSVKK